MATALVADPIYREHLAGRSDHPERPGRYDAIMRALEQSGCMHDLIRIPARAASEKDLLLCHTPEYLRIARRDVVSGMPCLSTGDTDIGAESWEVAEYAAGGVLAAIDAVVSGTARNAFCVVRPPGHHANASRGMGFCLFNNIAIGARYAQNIYGFERAVIIDWDVHHGNGTQDLFYSDPSVFFFSTHQWPLYPGTGRADETGEGAGKGTTMNFPFPAGSGRAEILGAVQRSLMPRMKNFRPDLVLISAGFDSRIGDLLGQFTLTDADFGDLTQAAMEIADTYANGRLISVLEGGYNLRGLASASARHIETLAGIAAETGTEEEN